jgi:predicted TIM-barrel fold metal-dependent hydrolase
MARRDFLHLSLGVIAGLAIQQRTRAETSTHPNITAVDTHAHIFRRDLTLVNGHRYAPNYDATLEQYLHLLDQGGMSHAVLVQPSFLGTDNSFLVAGLKTNPHRLRGVAVLDPTTSTVALDELAAAGVVGIRLNLVGLDIPDVKTEPWPSFLRQLARMDWLVEVQREAKDLPRIVDPLLEAGVNVVVDHFGRPDPKLGIADPGFRYLLTTASTRRVWVKLSGAYRNGPNGDGTAFARAAVPLLCDAFGPARLMWGSDWPHTQFEHVANYAAVRAQFDTWITNPTERATILADTPAKLFRFI